MQDYPGKTNITEKQGWITPVVGLSCRIQHIFDEDSVAPGWVIYQDMGHRSNQLAVLDDGTAAHE